MTWSQLLGGTTAVSIALLVVLCAASSVRREVRGPAPRQITLATSHPWWTALLTATALAAFTLVGLRLGYFS